MNDGLKRYTKQISQTIGEVAQVSININKENANMHILVPLLETLGPNPMDISLIFNYQDFNEQAQFGKGWKLNTYKEIKEVSLTELDIKEADGGTTRYTEGSDGYRSNETGLTVTKETEYAYILQDQQGNKIKYKEKNNYYPSQIEYVNGEIIAYFGKNMNNGHGSLIELEGTEKFTTRITYKQDGTTMSFIDFEYDAEDRLTNVRYYKENTKIKHLSISYSQTEIIIKDEILQNYASYTLINNRVGTIKEYVNGQESSLIKTSIDYEDRRTTITDYRGKKVYIYFDKSNYPLFEIDEEGNAKETEYDTVTKKLIAESSIIPTKTKLTTLSTPNISMFTKTSGIATRISTVTDPILSGIIAPVYSITGTGSLSYTIPTKGLGSDTITAVLWGKQCTNHTSTTKVNVRLSADGYDLDEFKKTEIDGNYDMMCLGVTAMKSYSNITLTITLTGNAEIEIGGIQILKKDFGAFYAYDEKGNMVQSESGQGTTSSVFNAKGLITTSLGIDSSLYHFEYDEKGNLTKAKTAYGGKVEYSYDSYNNLTKSTISNATGTKTIESNKTYQNGRFLTSETDELGNKTSFTYDSFGKIKKITNALSAITEYHYDAYDNLTRILFNNSTAADYEYDAQNKLTKVGLSNGATYRFEYDECNNLTKIRMNDVLIVSFIYDQCTGLITKQIYGEAGDYFEFSYDEKQNIQEVKFNGNSKYSYAYDSYNRLEKVLNSNQEILRTYSYDNDGQVIKVNDNGCIIEYDYDSLGEITQKKRSLNSKIIYESFDSISRFKGFSPENLIGYLEGNSSFLGTIFNGNADLKNPSYICKPYNYKTNAESEVTYTRKGMIPCTVCDLSVPMSYNPPMKNSYIEDAGCLGFWFYPTSTTKKYLFSLKHRTLVSYVAVYMNSSCKLVLEVKDSSNTIITRETTTTVNLNQWNFFGLNYMYRNDGLGYTKDFSYELFLNSSYIKGNIIGHTILTGSIAPYHIGYRFDGTNAYEGLNCHIAALMIGCRYPITTQQMQEYYSYTKDYILGATYIDENSVDFSATTTYNLSETMLNQFEIFPLHNSVKSLRGTLPTAYDVRRVSSTDKDRTFNYNNKSNRSAYVADEGRLEYELGMSSTGTIMMRVFLREEAEKQYVLECKDTTKTIGLYRDSNRILCIEAGGSVVKTNLTLSTNEWHTIGLSFTEGSVSESLGIRRYKAVRVFMDGKTYSTNITISSAYGKLTISLGRKFDLQSVKNDMGNYSTAYPLLGQIEMLAIRAAFCEVATLNTLSNELNSITKRIEYDELGMLQKIAIRNADIDIYTNTFSYKKRSTNSSYISKYIEKETIKYGSTTVNRSYGINALGNVTSITDTTFGSHTYTYNARGFLTKEDSTEYTYDDNGNITKAGSTTFTYDTTIKDRLKSVNGKEITYGTNPLNPASWNGLNYTFEGRRLTRYTYGGGYYSFEYNDQGLRISKKDYRGVGSKYYYDGDKLITEVAPSYRLDFLYDENDMLYGFIYNNSDKYYYVRDFMQNILGIIDKNGNLVVKYNYTAYGTITSISGSLAGTIGAYNPFRYKGYYYDTETKMYYCKSRYYVPEWCRWLNGDNVSYLQVQSINDMNLFSYCCNNPIMLSDSFGTNWWDDFKKGVSNCWNTVCNWVSNTFGVSVSTKKEIASPPQYYWFATVTTGVGYSKTYSNGKPVNFAVTLPDKWWKIWDFSLSIDVNVNGYGANLGLGGEASFGVHAGKSHFDVFGNAIGRVGFQYTVQEESGAYAFTRGSLNLPEIAVTIAAAYGVAVAAPYVIGAVGGALASLGFLIGGLLALI